MRKLRKPSDAWLFLRILFFVALVALILRLKLPRLLNLLEPKRAYMAAEAEKVDKIVKYVDAALQLARPLIGSGCLTRGLTLFYFLRRAGFDVALHFGMGKPAGKFEGHCWLVWEGEPFMEPRDPRLFFTEMFSFPSRPG